MKKSHMPQREQQPTPRLTTTPLRICMTLYDIHQGSEAPKYTRRQSAAITQRQSESTQQSSHLFACLPLHRGATHGSRDAVILTLDKLHYKLPKPRTLHVLPRLTDE
jgi:hypothetical protein